MKKLKLLLMLICLYRFTNAQDLIRYIPQNAAAVLSVKGDQVFSLLTVAEFDSSALGKKLLKNYNIHIGKSGELQSIADLGIAINATAYYYKIATDSITYSCLLLPLNNIEKFKKIFNKEEINNVKKAGYAQYYEDSITNRVFLWTNSYVLINNSAINDTYFYSDEVKDRYHISYNNGIADTTIAVTAEAATDTAVAITDDAVTVIDSAYTETDIAPMTDPKDYKYAYDKEKQIKDSLQKKWLLQYSIYTMENNATKHDDNVIPSFLTAQGNTAIASLYIPQVQLLPDLSNHFKYLMGVKHLGLKQQNKNYGSLALNMHASDPTTLKITAEMNIQDKYLSYFKNLLNHKFNKSLLKYIDPETAIGYLTYSYNMEAYMEYYPKIIATYLTGWNVKDDGEGALVADFISLLLDEKAIAKCINGDGVMVLTGISQKEKKYKSYDYDSTNFESKEIEKSRMESSPEFLIMFSSDDTRLLTKLLEYGIRKGNVVLQNGVYNVTSIFKEITNGYVSVLIKDGIVFIGTDVNALNMIHTNRFVSNISKQDKKILASGNMNFHFNPSKLKEGMEQNKNTGENTLSTYDASLNALLSNMGEITARTYPLKGNKLLSEIEGKTFGQSKNGLKYLLSLFEKAMKSEPESNMDAEGVAIK